jgi:hypothetical protein
MTANRFTLTSQINEIDLALQLYATKSNTVPGYRAERLGSVKQTLEWFERHQTEIKAFMALTQRKAALAAGQNA